MNMQSISITGIAFLILGTIAWITWFCGVFESIAVIKMKPFVYRFGIIIYQATKQISSNAFSIAELAKYASNSIAVRLLDDRTCIFRTRSWTGPLYTIKGRVQLDNRNLSIRLRAEVFSYIMVLSLCIAFIIGIIFFPSTTGEKSAATIISLVIFDIMILISAPILTYFEIKKARAFVHEITKGF